MSHLRSLATLLTVTVLLISTAALSHAQTAPTLPSGFRADVYVSGLADPTAMAFGPDKRLYVAQQNGLILAVGNHRVVTVASGFNTPLGLAWHAKRLYVSSMGRVSTLTPNGSYTSFTRRDIITGLPFGRHQNDEPAFHGGWMYLGIGSTCNACTESDPRSATIMAFRPDGSHGRIIAHGLRNPFGLAFRPHSGELYATDNGRDDFDDQVPDELNLIKIGRSYGWPNCWGTGRGSDCAGTVPPVVDLEPHASADGLTFYTGQTFPRRYRGDAFIAEWGQTVGSGYHGHHVVDVHWQGKRATASVFASNLSHPIDVTNARDGSLLIMDYGTGIIWHVQAIK